MQIINENEFKKIINEGTTLVDFFANWCGPCKMLGPVLEEVSKDYSDINFVKVDCDEALSLCQEFSIMSIPAVLLFKDGKLLNRFVGYKDEREVKSFIDENK